MFENERIVEAATFTLFGVRHANGFFIGNHRRYGMGALDHVFFFFIIYHSFHFDQL